MRWLSQGWTYRARALVPASWLTPGRLGDERLWIATEATVARGIAIGLFFGQRRHSKAAQGVDRS
ncbi:MAG: hypothetical protein IT483_06805 [Gammaproteobacteria bacterium]|nr:hypothetical protein [Gammaproteobacteria bacterium]